MNLLSDYIVFAYKTHTNIRKFLIFDYENFEVQLKTTNTWVLSLFFLVFTSQKKSFHAIISKPNKALWPNLSSLPQSVQL